MNNIQLTWSIEDIINLNIEQAPDPTIGFDLVDGSNANSYSNIISAGVYRGLPDFFDKSVLEKEFNWINNKGYAIHKMLPGSILPLHIDKYAYFSRQHNIMDFDKIVRVIIFLEDHKLGHILQIEDTPVQEWKAGDYVYWYGKKAHLAANFGTEARYTLQITGII